jgi:hypothetical protein
MPDLQLPAHLANRASRNLAGQLAASLPTGSVPYVSIKGSRFTLYDAAGNEQQVGAMSPDVGLYLDLCVVDSNPHISKVYYAKAFDPNAEGEQPDCYSDNGIGASAQALHPQSASCKTCPHNEWGSSVSKQTGKPTKACNDVQKVAVAVPGFPDKIFLLRIPPASLKWLGKYVQEVGSISAGGRKVDISDLITRVYFAKDQVGVLNFSPVAFVDAETASTGDKAVDIKATDLLVGKNDRPFTGEVGLPPPAKPAEQRTLAPPLPQAPPNRETLVTQGFLPAATGVTPGVAALRSEQEEPKKARGRPKKEPVQEAPATQAPFMAMATGSTPSTTPPITNGSDDDLELPNFLKRVDTPPAPAAKPAGPSFGMQQAQAAPEDMATRISAILGMKT